MEQLFSLPYQKNNMEQPNLNYIEEISPGDEAFKQKIITLLKTELPLEIKEFEKNFAEKSYILAASNVHKLKHKVGILGIPKAHELTSAFEQNLKGGSIELYDEFDQILKNITTFISKLQ